MINSLLLLLRHDKDTKRMIMSFLASITLLHIVEVFDNHFVVEAALFCFAMMYAVMGLTVLCVGFFPTLRKMITNPVGSMCWLCDIHNYETTKHPALVLNHTVTGMHVCIDGRLAFVYWHDWSIEWQR